MNLQNKLTRLNAFIENPENWFFHLHGKDYYPPSFENSPSMFMRSKDNVRVAAYVLLKGLGSIYKVARVSSDKYWPGDFPEDVWATIADCFFTNGEDHLPIYDDFFLAKPHSKDPKDIRVSLEAKWQPEGNWVKVLMEKRNFVTKQEFEAIEQALKGQYDKYGVKAPNYVTGERIVQVPGTIH